MYAVFADIVLLVHLLFIVFVVAGAFLVLRWPRLAWVHLPAAIWGAVVEFTGWICPLTPLENRFRLLSGRSAYGGSFVDRYLLPLLYPPGLDMNMQFILGTIVLLVNAGVYLVLWRRIRKHRENPPR